MIQWAIFISGWAVLFIQQIFQLGKLNGRVSSLEENIKWVRDYLLTHCVESKHFSQESPIIINDELEKTIPLSWIDTLDGAAINTEGCESPFDCIVRLSENQGAVRLKKRADDLNIEHNTFLLASGVHLYNKTKIMNKK